jgi:hypothetical protein
MYTVDIEGNNYYETQQWWQNFVEHLYDIHGDIPEKKYDKILAKELKKYKAKMIINKKTDDLVALLFNDEKYYTAFLMKWI